MPHRSSIPILLASALALSACGGEKETFRSEETTFEGNEPASVTDCVERFSTGRDVWGDAPVWASFVYDLSALGDNGVETFLGADPAKLSNHAVKITHNDPEIARNRFLGNKAKRRGTSELRAGEYLLLRQNFANQPFDETLRKGCANVKDGVKVAQVTFSKGQR